MDEKEKYRLIYLEKLSGFENYGHSNEGRNSYGIVEQLSPTSIVDVGCGYNEFCLHFRPKINKCIGVDFVCPSADVISDASKLPFSDKEFDLLTAFDVLEHIRIEEIDLVLSEFKRVSNKYIFSICYRDSVYKVFGETLHPTIKPKEWWVEKIKNLGTVSEDGRYFYGYWL